jgi:hypothetical protein
VDGDGPDVLDTEPTDPSAAALREEQILDFAAVRQELLEIKALLS